MCRRTETAYKAHQAVRQLREYLRQGYRIAVDIDLAKFFDTVNHDLLMTLVGRKVRDKRVRRRVRLCYWKQWRWCRTKIRNLLSLGVQLGTSIRAGLNRGGPWAMARRLAAQHGMTNQWLKDQGLVSVKELWVKTHYPATAR